MAGARPQTEELPPVLNDLRDRVLPASQRRTLDELTDELVLRSGDPRSKKSAFWTMLVLSAVIAGAGVLADSTATVIGAMIIAPLSTPIMGMALGVVTGHRNGSGWFVLGGGLLVVSVGVVFAALLTTGVDLVENSQVAARTSPRMLDLVAAIATGLAGAVALARRDVAAVLPGVAIAISLVPPLVVTGICLGHGEPALALGALVLFASNLISLVLAGVVTFAALGYAGREQAGRPLARRSRVVLGGLLAIIAVPLAANTALAILVSTWSDRIDTVTRAWLEDSPGAAVTDVRFASLTAYVSIRHDEPLPATGPLLDHLEQVLPPGVTVVLDTTRGRELELGTTAGGHPRHDTRARSAQPKALGRPCLAACAQSFSQVGPGR
jgi:uncharacterized hydrophobic protein (TIGR00271 family)